MAYIIGEGIVVPNKEVPAIISGGPTPTTLRVAAYRAPESGYASQVPNTLYTQFWDPSVVDYHRLQTKNTGWESGAASLVSVPTDQTYRVGGGFAVVESGGPQVRQGDPEWCCDWWDPFQWGCDAEQCKEQDLEAARVAAEKSGGGVIVERTPDGITHAIAVVEVEEGLIFDTTTVTGRRDPGFQQKVEEKVGEGTIVVQNRSTRAKRPDGKKVSDQFKPNNPPPGYVFPGETTQKEWSTAGAPKGNAFIGLGLFALMGYGVYSLIKRKR